MLKLQTFVFESTRVKRSNFPQMLTCINLAKLFSYVKTGRVSAPCA
jgi:hypothetical protein